MFRIVLDPAGGDETLLLDWGDAIRPLRTPTRQDDEVVQIAGADWSQVFCYGNGSTEIEVVRRLTFATHEELAEAQIDKALALPLNKTLALHLRVFDLSGQGSFPAASPAIGGGPEGTATHAHYIAAESSITSADPVPLSPGMHLEISYRIKVGQLVKQP